jgi:hypothetical protein
MKSRKDAFNLPNNIKVKESRKAARNLPNNIKVKESRRVACSLPRRKGKVRPITGRERPNGIGDIFNFGAR